MASRQLLCEKCGKDNIAHARHYAGEHQRFVPGTINVQSPGDIKITSDGNTETIKVETCICDSCSAEMPPGTRAYAWTVWVGRKEFPHWEQEFMAITAFDAAGIVKM